MGELFKARSERGASVDEWVLVGGELKLRMRLLVAQVPEAQKKGRAPSRARLALVGYNVYVTNAPEEMLSLRDAVVLARARWQIGREADSGNGLAKTRSRDPVPIVEEPRQGG